MQEFKSINDVLNFAIQAEQEAVEFYTSLAGKARNIEMKEVFTRYAMEEMGHKARLKSFHDEGVILVLKEPVMDLKISDYLVDIVPTPDMTYKDALVLAMKKEKAAYKLYVELSEKVSSKMLSEVFMSLAQEEAKHKLRFEVEYDDYVLGEN